MLQNQLVGGIVGESIVVGKEIDNIHKQHSQQKQLAGESGAASAVNGFAQCFFAVVV